MRSVTGASTATSRKRSFERRATCTSTSRSRWICKTPSMRSTRRSSRSFTTSLVSDHEVVLATAESRRHFPHLLDVGLYKRLQILTITLFEKMPISTAVFDVAPKFEDIDDCTQLQLFVHARARGRARLPRSDALERRGASCADLPARWAEGNHGSVPGPRPAKAGGNRNSSPRNARRARSSCASASGGPSTSTRPASMM